MEFITDRDHFTDHEGRRALLFAAHEHSETDLASFMAGLKEVARIGQRAANVHRTDALGRTAFWLACAEGRLDCLRLIIGGPLAGHDAAARFTARRSVASGTPPLFMAARNGHLDVTKFLLAGPCQAVAAQEGSELPVVVNRGPTRGRHAGWTPLDASVAEGHDEVAAALEAAGGRRRRRKFLWFWMCME